MMCYIELVATGASSSCIHDQARGQSYLHAHNCSSLQSPDGLLLETGELSLWLLEKMYSSAMTEWWAWLRGAVQSAKYKCAKIKIMLSGDEELEKVGRQASPLPQRPRLYRSQIARCAGL